MVLQNRILWNEAIAMDADIISNFDVVLDNTVCADTYAVSNRVLFSDEDMMPRLKLIPDQATGVYDGMRSNNGIITNGSG